jgi:hypothetical protein
LAKRGVKAAKIRRSENKSLSLSPQPLLEVEGWGIALRDKITEE